MSDWQWVVGDHTFTPEDLVAEIDRELKMRKRVYPGLIQQNKLTRAQAERQVAALECVRTLMEDYLEPEPQLSLLGDTADYEVDRDRYP